MRIKRILAILVFAGSLLSCSDDTWPSAGKTNVLWLGTSIPSGCSYPSYSCKSNGAYCLNKAVGSSFMCSRSVEEKGVGYAGLSLTETVDEKEKRYRRYVDNGKLSRKRLKAFKASSYENAVLPYVGSADVVVVDHGFNDIDNLYELYKDRNTIPDNDTLWNSFDRSNYIGAFNYLMREIKKVNSGVVVMVGGYFQNSCTIDYTAGGRYIQQVSEDIARHYGIQVLDVWNYVDIPDGYKPGSENYIDSINRKYRKNFVKWNPNVRGEITYFQIFCPDAVHPFSDPTGTSQRTLNAAFSEVMAKRLAEAGYKKSEDAEEF